MGEEEGSGLQLERIWEARKYKRWEEVQVTLPPSTSHPGVGEVRLPPTTGAESCAPSSGAAETHSLDSLELSQAGTAGMPGSS